MAYGKQTAETAERLALARGVTLFKPGAHVVTNHGNAGIISEVEAYGSDTGLYWGMSTYTVHGPAFGPSGMRVDFVDAHHTLGGCLRAAAEPKL